MAEVGLLPFARIALQVSKAVLPRYRSRFSKHQFDQPQLLAVLCLMRYEDWTFREAEVRLGEHRELRQALGLVSVPDFTTLYRFLQRLDDVTIDRAVGETVRRLRGAHRKGRRRARVAVDATGLAQGAVSTFFVRRMHHHGQKPLPWRHWLKWVVVVDLDQQFLLSQIARRGPWNDCANLPAVVEAASEQTRIGLVLADAEFDSERNHTYIRQQLGAQSVIPAKRGKKTWRIHGVRAEMRRAFPRRLYRRRALIESLFSSVKRKLSARAPGRSLRTQKRQALLLGLSFNLYRLRHRYPFTRMSTEPRDVLDELVEKKITEDKNLFRSAWTKEVRPRLEYLISRMGLISDENSSEWREFQDRGLTGEQLKLKRARLSAVSAKGIPKKILDIINTILGSIPGAEAVKEFKELVEEEISDGPIASIIARFI
jgi:hypothetical protein